MNEDRMTPEALAEIEGLAKKATKGTWVVDKMGRYEDHDECRIDLPDDETELCRYENADLIAASRPPSRRWLRRFGGRGRRTRGIETRHPADPERKEGSANDVHIKVEHGHIGTTYGGLNDE